MKLDLQWIGKIPKPRFKVNCTMHCLNFYYLQDNFLLTVFSWGQAELRQCPAQKIFPLIPCGKCGIIPFILIFVRLRICQFCFCLVQSDRAAAGLFRANLKWSDSLLRSASGQYDLQCGCSLSSRVCDFSIPRTAPAPSELRNSRLGVKKFL